MEGDIEHHLYDYENDSVKCHIYGTASSTNGEDQQDDGSTEVPWL